MKGHQYRRQLFEYSDWITEQIVRAKAYQTSYCNISSLCNHFDQAIENLKLCLFFYECLMVVKRLCFDMCSVFIREQQFSWKVTKILEQT